MIRISDNLILTKYSIKEVCIYKIRSVVFHYGESPNQGHYIAKVFNTMQNSKCLTTLNDEGITTVQVKSEILNEIDLSYSQ